MKPPVTMHNLFLLRDTRRLIPEISEREVPAQKRFYEL